MDGPSSQGVCWVLVPWALLTILSFVWRPHGQHYFWEAFLFFPEHPSVGKGPSHFEMLFALGSVVLIVILVNCYSCSFIMGRGTGRKGAALVGLSFPAAF